MLTEIAPRDFLRMVEGVRLLEDLYLRELRCLEGDASEQGDSDRVMVESILHDLSEALGNITSEAARLVNGGMDLDDIITAMSGGAAGAALIEKFERAWWRTLARQAGADGGQDGAPPS
jgi:hypothetical protein